MVRVRLVCSRGVDGVYPVRVRWNPCLRLHWTSNHPTDTSAGVSDPGQKDESARPRDNLFSSGVFAVGGLPQRLVPLHVAYPISTSADHLNSSSNPSCIQVLATIPQTNYSKITRHSCTSWDHDSSLKTETIRICVGTCILRFPVKNSFSP